MTELNRVEEVEEPSIERHFGIVVAKLIVVGLVGGLLYPYIHIIASLLVSVVGVWIIVNQMGEYSRAYTNYRVSERL